ncbi:MAG: PAS domain S-box protein [Deltaproteobacteria bacterium]
MNDSRKNRQQLLDDLQELRERMAESEETLRAILSGEVDGLVVKTPEGDSVFTLSGADHPYRIMVETMNEGAVTLAADGTILFCNQGFADMVATPPENITGNSIYRFIKTVQRTLFEDFIQRASKGGRIEISLLAADGTCPAVLLSKSFLRDGTLGSICLLASDVTELREAQQALQESHCLLEVRVEERTQDLQATKVLTQMQAMRLQATLDATPAIIWIAHDRHCREITGNHAAYQFSRAEESANLSKTGPGKEHLTHYRVFKDGSELLPEDMPIQRVALSGEPLWNHSVDFLFDDGTTRSLLGNVIPMRDDQGELSGAIAAFIDVTEHARAEEALKKKAAELTAANKELESFSYSVSHDLRTPLRAIDGFSRMLERKYAATLEKDALEKLNVIRANTRKMDQFINDLLAFSRLSRTAMSSAEVDMQNLIETIWTEIKNDNLDRQPVFKINGLPSVLGDSSLLSHVLTNLLSNAVKFSRHRTPAVIEVTCHREDNEVVFCVKDNGVGFDMQYADKLFGVFQRLHTADEFEGTGVGLAIVKRIIHRHGGRVWAESILNEGASFYFTLPAGQKKTVVSSQ